MKYLLMATMLITSLGLFAETKKSTVGEELGVKSCPKTRETLVRNQSVDKKSSDVKVETKSEEKAVKR